MIMVEPRSHHPPPYQSNVVLHKKKFRFVDTLSSAAPHTFTISASKLCALVSMCTVVNSTVVQWFETVRVHYVEVWGNPQSSASGVNYTSITTVGVNYDGVNTGAGSDNQMTDTALGSNGIAHVKLRPKKATQADQWQSGQTNVGTGVLFTITCAAQSLIEVCVSLATTANARSTNNSLTIVSGALGVVYYMALDNTAGSGLSSSNSLTPDPALNTTV